jgi:hypothetical protein
MSFYLLQERMFQFWFNTFFIGVGAKPIVDEELDPTLFTYADENSPDVRWVTIPKNYIDKAHKDEKCKLFAVDFKVRKLCH